MELEFELKLWLENWIRTKIDIISWTEITLLYSHFYRVTQLKRYH